MKRVISKRHHTKTDSSFFRFKFGCICQTSQMLKIPVMVNEAIVYYCEHLWPISTLNVSKSSQFCL